MSKTKIYNLSHEWSHDFLVRIRERDLVIYNGKGCYAVKIHLQHQSDPVYEILSVKDYVISDIPLEHRMLISSENMHDLIQNLNDAKKYWLELQKTG